MKKLMAIMLLSLIGCGSVPETGKIEEENIIEHPELKISESVNVNLSGEWNLVEEVDLLAVIPLSDHLEVYFFQPYYVVESCKITLNDVLIGQEYTAEVVCENDIAKVYFHQFGSVENYIPSNMTYDNGAFELNIEGKL